MAGIKIDFVANVGKFIGGTKDVEKALDGVSGSLDEVAADATKLEGKFTESMKAVKAASKSTGDAIGTNVKRGTKQAAEGFDDVKKEAAASARGMATSFRGGAEDISQFIQETFAQALTGLGPLGAAAGIAAAVGIGALVSQLQKAADETNKAKEKTVEFTQALREVDGDINRLNWNDIFAKFGDTIGDTKEWWELFQDSAKTNLELARGYAQQYGLDFKDVFKGLAGAPDSAQRALDAVNQKLADQTAEMNRLVSEGMDPVAAATVTQVSGLTDLANKLGAAKKMSEDAADAQKELATVTGKSERVERDYRATLLDSLHAAEDWNDVLDERMGKLKDLAGIQMDADEAEAAWIKAQQDSKTALEGATGAATKQRKEWNLNTEAGQAASSAAIDLAKRGWEYIQSLREQGKSSTELETASGKVREAFIKNVTQFGLNAEAANKLATEYGLVPKDIATTATLDTSGAETSLAAYVKKLEAAFGPRSTSLYDNWTFQTPTTSAVPVTNITVNAPVTTTFDAYETSRQIAWNLQGQP